MSKPTVFIEPGEVTVFVESDSEENKQIVAQIQEVLRPKIEAGKLQLKIRIVEDL
jgi:hypothetical protein